METPDLQIFLDWQDHAVQLAPRVCVVIVAAFVSIRVEWLRRALRSTRDGWRDQLVATVFFSVWAVTGTHTGIILGGDGNNERKVDCRFFEVTGKLAESQAIMGFRDSMALVAGLVGGPWVGLGTGFLAGAERWYLGGPVAYSSAVSTIYLGLGAGLARHYWPLWAISLRGAMFVALVGSFLHSILVVALALNDRSAPPLAREIIGPVAFTNVLGCILFLWIMADLDRERWALLKLKQAKIDAHFLNNALSNIDSEVGAHPSEAKAALLQLARYFDRIHKFAEAEMITLDQEIEFLDHYLAIQKFRFEDNLILEKVLMPELGRTLVPPRCLQTLVENAFDHAYPGGKRPFRLRLAARARPRGMELEVCDNGPGMTPERCAELGKQPVVSASRWGSGTALYSLAQTLELAYGSRAALSLTSKPGEGTCARLTLPGLTR